MPVECAQCHGVGSVSGLPGHLVHVCPSCGGLGVHEPRTWIGQDSTEDQVEATIKPWVMLGGFVILVALVCLIWVHL